jgi:hypothetical protein
MSQILANVPDVSTFAANIVVFLAAIAAAVAGAMSAVKKIKESWLDSVKSGDTPVAGKHLIAAASIIETTTLLMWSESNRDVCECIHSLKEEITALRHEMEIQRAIGDRR